LKQLKEEGEEHNRPVSELFKAATAYLLDNRKFLFIELGRYIQKYGHLEPIDYDTGATIDTTEAKEEVPQAEAFPPLKALPPAYEQPKKRFSKSYGE
jgi:hypothetical protein